VKKWNMSQGSQVAVEPDIQAGMFKDIDEYVEELREAGYEADYENVWEGTSGFTAIMTVNGETHAVFEGQSHGHLVKEVKQGLRHISQ